MKAQRNENNQKTYFLEFLPGYTICRLQQITGHFCEIFHIFLCTHVALFRIKVGQAYKYVHSYTQVPSEYLCWSFGIVCHRLSSVRQF